MAQTFKIGPVEVTARTKTDAREQAITAAAKLLEKLEHCPEPIPGPPDTEILAIAFVPLDRYAWRVQYVFPDRVLTHDYQHEIGEVRKFACGFVVEHGLNRATTSTQIERLTTWVEKHLALSALDADRIRERLALLVRQCEAYYELQCVRVVGKPGPLTGAEIHSVLMGDPSLAGELAELSVSVRERFRLQ